MTQGRISRSDISFSLLVATGLNDRDTAPKYNTNQVKNLKGVLASDSACR